jgi:hypothetical protein
MAAPVRIEARAWNDIRFVTLARILRLADSDHALIKVARLWSWQTEHFASDRPTYVLDGDTIESVLGSDGPAALVRAKLATEVAGGYRLHGTEGQIEWCEELSSKRQHAGRKRADGARRDERGRLLPKTGELANSQSSTSPARVQQPTSSPPAQSSAPAPDPTPVLPEQQNLPPAGARAIPPSPEPEPEPVPARGPGADVTVDLLWSELEAARDRLADDLGLKLPPLLAHDSGRAELASALSLARGSQRTELAAQVRHAIAVAASEADADREKLRWFTGAIFSPRNFRRLVAEPPPKPRRKPAARAPEPAPIAPEDRADPADFAAARAVLGFATDGVKPQ